MAPLRTNLFSQRYSRLFVSASCRIRTPLFSHRLGLELLSTRAFSTYRPPSQQTSNEPKKFGKLTNTLRENIYTVPNLLTLSRIAACPVLGYAIVQDNFTVATALLAYAGLTDLVCLPILLLRDGPF